MATLGIDFGTEASEVFIQTGCNPDGSRLYEKLVRFSNRSGLTLIR